MGGDGTLHEVVNGLFIQQEVRPDDVLLAVIAVGTGNDWVRTFGISSRYQDAVRAIREGYSFLQDVGVVSYEESHYRRAGIWPTSRARVSTACGAQTLAPQEERPQGPLALYVVYRKEFFPI